MHLYQSAGFPTHVDALLSHSVTYHIAGDLEMEMPPRESTCHMTAPNGQSKEQQLFTCPNVKQEKPSRLPTAATGKALDVIQVHNQE